MIIFALGFSAVRSAACLVAALRFQVMTSPQYQVRVRFMPEFATSHIYSVLSKDGRFIYRAHHHRRGDKECPEDDGQPATETQYHYL